MARMTFKAGDDFALRLSRLGAQSGEIAKKAIKAGAGIAADKIRANLEALPEDKFRYLRGDEKLSGVPLQQKKDLLDSLGVTPVDMDKAGNWNAKIGFDGYGKAVTKKYPKGVPNSLLARAVESGSSVRRKTPFIRPAMTAVKESIHEAMNEAVDNEIKKII